MKSSVKKKVDTPVKPSVKKKVYTQVKKKVDTVKSQPQQFQHRFQNKEKKVYTRPVRSPVKKVDTPLVKSGVKWRVYQGVVVTLAALLSFYTMFLQKKPRKKGDPVAFVHEKGDYPIEFVLAKEGYNEITPPKNSINLVDNKEDTRRIEKLQQDLSECQARLCKGYTLFQTVEGVEKKYPLPKMPAFECTALLSWERTFQIKDKNSRQLEREKRKETGDTSPRYYSIKEAIKELEKELETCKNKVKAFSVYVTSQIKKK